MATDAQRILDKLDAIQADLDDLRRHVVDVDAVLTEEDLVAIQEADADLKHARTRKLA